MCHAAVGLVGDICRALGPMVTPFCDEIMTILLENLSNNDVHRMVKPQVLSVFGDIALALGLEFKKYLDVVLQTLMQASQAQVDRVGRFVTKVNFIFLLEQRYRIFIYKSKLSFLNFGSIEDSDPFKVCNIKILVFADNHKLTKCPV